MTSPEQLKTIQETHETQANLALKLAQIALPKFQYQNNVRSMRRITVDGRRP